VPVSDSVAPLGSRTAAQWGERAKLLARAGSFSGAEDVLRLGLEAHPGHPVLSYALGILLLARGSFEEGWRLYEHRVALPRGPRAPGLSFPQWKGEPVGSLMLLPEQGFGDQIMFARYVPALIAKGIRVTLVTPPPLARLFTSLGADVLPVEGSLSIPRRDAWCFVGSLPRIMGYIPTTPYLPSPPDGSGIGFILRGDSKHPGDKERSLPRDLAEDLQRLGISLHPEDSGAVDFQDTADMIAGLEAVVAVDTAGAHLAGAMGKPCWLLLPSVADWRWGRSGDTTLWYRSMRLFRQNASGDWRDVLDSVRSQLVAI